MCVSNLKNKLKVIVALFLVTFSCLQLNAQSQNIEAYNVIWESPSKDASGQMPFGNGDIAAGIYAIEDGDLYLLLSKNDAFTYWGDLFKTGRVRISFSSNPFAKGKSFRQTMDMKSGSVQIEADGIKIRIWGDANRPVYHVEINSPKDINVSAEPEFWKRFDKCGSNNKGITDTGLQEIAEHSTQDVRVDKDGKIIWYYSVGDRSVFNEDMKYYGVEELIGKYPDPFIYNTFGNLLESPDLTLKQGSLTGNGKQFDIRIHSLTKQTADVSDWINEIEQQSANPINTEKDWIEHSKWWSDFWNRSWIFVSDNTLPSEDKLKLNGEGYKTTRTEKDGTALVTQSYNVFRYLMACQSRGKIQTKFNGGIFTQPLRSTDADKWSKIVSIQEDGTLLSHEDDRDWGRRFTYQNQRLLYWPLIASGDYDLIKPFFNYYSNLLPIRKAITKSWFGHEGAYYRENTDPTGAERDNGRDGKPPKTKPGKNKGKGYYHSYYFTSGLETVAMMIDYVKVSDDKEFQENKLVPQAREVLLFFDKHYKRDRNGMLVLDPAMVLETYWIAVNPAPDIAGLQFCLDELINMNIGTEADKSNWKRFRAEIPLVYLQKIQGREAIAPAKKYKMKRNAENGELYPVFPFTLFGVAQGTEDIVEWTMANRTSVNSFDFKCWTQDQIHWAYAGNAKEAKDGLIHRFRHASTQCRFPLYGSQGPDSCEWDVDFKLYAPYSTTIEGTVKNGKIEHLKVTPESRMQDVIIKNIQ